MINIVNLLSRITYYMLCSYYTITHKQVFTCVFHSSKIKVFYLKPTQYVGVICVIVMEARKVNVEGAVRNKLILEFVLGY